jgi:hypothetical protein
MRFFLYWKIALQPSDQNMDKMMMIRVWIESKKLWHMVGPAIFSRLASYSMLIITQAFAGYLGDLEFAATSIANNVVVGFNFGLLVRITSISHYIYTVSVCFLIDLPFLENRTTVCGTLYLFFFFFNMSTQG